MVSAYHAAWRGFPHVAFNSAGSLPRPSDGRQGGRPLSAISAKTAHAQRYASRCLSLSVPGGRLLTVASAAVGVEGGVVRSLISRAWAWAGKDTFIPAVCPRHAFYYPEKSPHDQFQREGKFHLVGPRAAARPPPCQPAANQPRCNRRRLPLWCVLPKWIQSGRDSWTIF